MGVSMGALPNCYGFPDQQFSPTNFVHVCDPSPGCKDDSLTVKTGMQAPSFTLSDRSGKPFTLEQLTHDKPMFLEFGSFS